MSWPKFALGLFVPHSVVMMAGDVLNRPDRRLEESLALQREHAAGRDHSQYSFEAAVAHLLARGLPEPEVRAGSMPEESLTRCRDVLRDRLAATRPLTILHVGNFVGVSLSWFADLARAWSDDSRVIAIDPNVTHRGLERPQEHVISLLTAFGLEDLVLLVTGYTLGKNPSDLDLDDPRGHFARDQSCPNALPKLAGLAPGRVDVAVMDGNHEPVYLRRELAEIRTLLRPGGLLVLDDVFDWRSLAPVAAELEASPGASLLARDDRFGVWQLA
jgi:predicted O-methyltransferase YrrM